GGPGRRPPPPPPQGSRACHSPDYSRTAPLLQQETKKAREKSRGLDRKAHSRTGGLVRLCRLSLDPAAELFYGAAQVLARAADVGLRLADLLVVGAFGFEPPVSGQSAGGPLDPSLDVPRLALDLVPVPPSSGSTRVVLP